MKKALASRISFDTSKVTDPSETQVTTATNQVIEISGKGTASIAISEDTKVSTTIITSKDIVHNILFISRGVMEEMGMLRAFENQESVISGHPH